MCRKNCRTSIALSRRWKATWPDPANNHFLSDARPCFEGIELTRELKPDVVIADIEMPKKTGLELADWIKEKKLATRVIIVTTFARSGYLRRALDAGVSGYLLKDSPEDDVWFQLPRELYAFKSVPCRTHNIDVIFKRQQRGQRTA